MSGGASDDGLLVHYLQVLMTYANLLSQWRPRRAVCAVLTRGDRLYVVDFFPLIVSRFVRFLKAKEIAADRVCLRILSLSGGGVLIGTLKLCGSSSADA